MILLALATAGAIPCVSARAIDGDDFWCTAPSGDRVNVRLLGIDAPEMPGHCRKGRRCAPGDPFAAKRSLARGLMQGRVSYRTIHVDRYGRPDAVVMAGKVNLSCWQLSRSAAVYVARFDQGGAIGRACR